MHAISKTLDSAVSLVGQASQRTSYYRRYLILGSLLSDYKKAKTMLNDWKSALVDNTSKDLFANKFEKEICRSSKCKTKSKEVFKRICFYHQPKTCQDLGSLRPSPGSPISEVFVPRGSSVPVPTGRKVKVFSEKLEETVQRPSYTKYDFGVQGTLFRSSPTKQIPETSANVQEGISVSRGTEIKTLQKKGQSK